MRERKCEQVVDASLAQVIRIQRILHRINRIKVLREDIERLQALVKKDEKDLFREQIEVCQALTMPQQVFVIGDQALVVTRNFNSVNLLPVVQVEGATARDLEDGA